MSVETLVGQTLGQYELRELLGAGGMGAVYKGYQPSLDRQVAIKILPPIFLEQPGFLERFNREARTLALLPRLVPGTTGRVTLSPNLPNRVRSSPRVSSSNYLGQIKPGHQFRVISGPVCDPDGRQWRWWYVQKDSLVGWTAEGQPGEYWVEPWP